MILEDAGYLAVGMTEKDITKYRSRVKDATCIVSRTNGFGGEGYAEVCNSTISVVTERVVIHCTFNR